MVRDADGDEDRVEVETLQPPEWVEAENATPGGTVPIPFDMREMGLPDDLRAEVLANQPCPPLEGGEGRVVLSTISHLSQSVGRLVVEDDLGRQESIRPTASHRFYRESDGKWVPLESLQPGDRLRGATGVLRVAAVSREHGVDRVYNMTVEGEHVYYVSTLGVLAHNGCSVTVGEVEVVAEKPVAPPEAEIYEFKPDGYEPPPRPNPLGEPTVEPPADGGEYGLAGERNGPKGGAYGKVRSGTKGGEVNHSPPASVSPYPYRKSPAFWMETVDHRKTASWGSSNAAKTWRAKQEALINEGKLREAIQMDIDDIRLKFGNKYDKNIREMLAEFGFTE